MFDRVDLKTIDGLPYERRMMYYAFRSENPEIFKWPYIIFKTELDVILAISEVTGCLLGLWGESPYVDQSNNPFCTDADRASDFILWEMSDNQEYISDLISRGGNVFQVLMLINTKMDRSILDKINNDLDKSTAGYDDKENIINLLPEWIELLGWAIVGIPTENQGYSMFITSMKNASLVESIRKIINNKGIKTYKLEKSEKGFLWTIPDERNLVRGPT